MLKATVSLIVSAFALMPFIKSADAQDCKPSPDESQIWDAVKGSTDALDFAAYLKDYPKGCFRAVAVFKLRSLVPEVVPLIAQMQVAGDGAWYQAGNGGFLTHGDNVVESMKVRVDALKLGISYSCDAAGRGVTNGANDSACPSNGRAPIQGFSVAMSGGYGQFYQASTECTVRKGDHSTYHPVSSDGAWCGAHGGTPQEYVVNIKVTVTRKPLN